MGDTGKKSLSFVSVLHLPEDPPPHPELITPAVKDGDYRRGLLPGKDLAVCTKQPLSAGTVLGLYRSIVVTKAEEAKAKARTPTGYSGNRWEWCRVLDAYTADILQPSRLYKETVDVYTDALQVRLLVRGACCCCISVVTFILWKKMYD